MRPVGGAVVGSQHHEQVSRLDRVSGTYLDPLHDPIALGKDLVLHLHRLQHDKHRPRSHRGARAVLDRHDHTGKRSADL